MDCECANGIVNKLIVLCLRWERKKICNLLDLFLISIFFVKPKKSLFVALRYWEKIKHALRQSVVISVIELLRNPSHRDLDFVFFMNMNTKKKALKNDILHDPAMARYG